MIGKLISIVMTSFVIIKRHLVIDTGYKKIENMISNYYGTIQLKTLEFKILCWANIIPL